jgi:type IV secretion system protein VirB6
MIALAPFFIILMLFEQTKSIFDNWLSTLFSYMIQPTILLIFFLLIDQVMSTQLSKIVVRACWGELIPIALGLDLTNMGMPQVNFSVTLPFLPAIPFFVPDVQNPTTIDDLLNSTGTFLVIFTSTLIFYAYCKMASGLVDYISIISSRLTNVAPPRQEGDYQAPANPTNSIMKDIKDVTAPFKDATLAPIKLFKDKVIDQNYGAKKTDDSGKEYTGKIFASRSDSDGENSKIDDK